MGNANKAFILVSAETKRMLEDLAKRRGMDIDSLIRSLIEKERRELDNKPKRIWITQYTGGLFYLLPHILKLIPRHDIYVEVFGGLGVVLLNKPKAKLEVFNDIDDNIVNLFTVIRDHFDEFQWKVQWLLYSRSMWKKYAEMWKKDRFRSLNPVDRAVAYFYLLSTSINACLVNPSFSAKTSIERQVTSFKNASERLKFVHLRLQNVLIENLDFRDCMRKYDGEKVFFFLDPPYLIEDKIYNYGFSLKDHYDLARILRQIKGKYLLVHVENKRFYEVYSDIPVIAKVEKPRHMLVGLEEKPKQNVLFCGNYDPRKEAKHAEEIPLIEFQ
ncbi:MAG: DNA adenine methylase [Candidatus Baldrarchaeia archaeon]